MICFCKKDVEKLVIGKKASPDGDFKKQKWIQACEECVNEWNLKNFNLV